MDSVDLLASCRYSPYPEVPSQPFVSRPTSNGQFSVTHSPSLNLANEVLTCDPQELTFGQTYPSALFSRPPLILPAQFEWSPPSLIRHLRSNFPADMAARLRQSVAPEPARSSPGARSKLTRSPLKAHPEPARSSPGARSKLTRSPLKAHPEPARSSPGARSKLAGARSSLVPAGGAYCRAWHAPPPCSAGEWRASLRVTALHSSYRTQSYRSSHRRLTERRGAAAVTQTFPAAQPHSSRASRDCGLNLPANYLGSYSYCLYWLW